MVKQSGSFYVYFMDFKLLLLTFMISILKLFLVILTASTGKPVGFLLRKYNLFYPLMEKARYLIMWNKIVGAAVSFCSFVFWFLVIVMIADLFGNIIGQTTKNIGVSFNAWLTAHHVLCTVAITIGILCLIGEISYHFVGHHYDPSLDEQPSDFVERLKNNQV